MRKNNQAIGLNATVALIVAAGAVGCADAPKTTEQKHMKVVDHAM